MSRVVPLSQAGSAADCVGLLGGTETVTLRDLTGCARFGLKGPGADTWFTGLGPLPQVNHWLARDGVRILRLGMRDITVLADPATSAPVDAMRADWEAGGEGYSSWREETWAWLRLSGPAAFDVASRLTSIDLRPKAFGLDQILQTRFAHLDAVLLRAGPDADAGLDILFDIAATAQVVRDISAAIQRHEVFG